MSRGDIQAAVSVLSGGRLAASDLERHVELLAGQAGSAPPRHVTTQTLQKLARAAAQPKQFVRSAKLTSHMLIFLVVIYLAGTRRFGGVVR